MTIISPSLLAADFTDLKKDIARLNDSQAKWLHLDIMDGTFVPNISFGFDIIKQIRPLTKLYFDCHLMIENPHKYIKRCAEVGCELVTFHLEAYNDNSEILKTIKLAKENNLKVGISIKPNTDVILLKPFLKEIDLVLIMSVEPGFGGQSFMSEVLDKVRYLKNFSNDKAYSFKIEIDGGINESTAKLAIDAGCDILVAGSYLFKEDLNNRIELLKNANN